MKIATFKRGVHPKDSKLTAYNTIKDVLPNLTCVLKYPLQQHIGAPCKPLVVVGDRVLKGQKIAEGQGFVTTSIHSSVSGEVTKISEIINATGDISKAIFIQNDNLEETVPNFGDKRDYLSLSRDEILAIVKDSGIVGLGGAGFPTHVKLNPPKDKTITNIIINGAECEPYLTTDHRVMLENTDRLIESIKLLMHLFPNAKCSLGIEINKLDAIRKIESLSSDIENFEVVGLIPKYPQGAEKQLILAITDKEVPSGSLPHDIGCLVINVDTILAVQNAVCNNVPLIERILTLTGDCIVNPGNYRVRIGSSAKNIVESIGGLKEEPFKVIAGGPMMGKAIHELQVPLSKTTSSFIFLTEKSGKLPTERNCIRCGKCVDFCPAGLLPVELNRIVLDNNLNEFVQSDGVDCIECGSCSYICPSKRHLAQSIRAFRRTALSKKLRKER